MTMARFRDRPIPPVVNGESSGSTALPSSALATGAPSMSASCVNLFARVQRALAGQYRDLAAGS